MTVENKIGMGIALLLILLFIGANALLERRAKQ